VVPPRHPRNRRSRQQRLFHDRPPLCVVRRRRFTRWSLIWVFDPMCARSSSWTQTIVDWAAIIIHTLLVHTVGVGRLRSLARERTNKIFYTGAVHSNPNDESRALRYLEHRFPISASPQPTRCPFATGSSQIGRPIARGDEVSSEAGADRSFRQRHTRRSTLQNPTLPAVPRTSGNIRSLSIPTRSPPSFRSR
jgi:hypothetical protein